MEIEIKLNDDNVVMLKNDIRLSFLRKIEVGGIEINVLINIIKSSNHALET